MLSRTCPSCKSLNARRSKARTAEITLRHLFLSPYRCRDCRAQFWALSRHTYHIAGLLVGVVAVMFLAWYAGDLLDMPTSEVGTAGETDARLPQLLKLAEKDDPVAEYEISRIYANGFGVVQSPQEEHRWLERSAHHGNVQAQYEYAIALRDGRGTIQDYQEAHKWMQAAAENRNAAAQYALGQMYRSGVGVPVNNLKAYIWLNVAAARGVAGATAARDHVASKLSAAELQEAQVEARRISEAHLAKNTQPAQ